MRYLILHTLCLFLVFSSLIFGNQSQNSFETSLSTDYLKTKKSKSENNSSYREKAIQLIKEQRIDASKAYIEKDEVKKDRDLQTLVGILYYTEANQKIFNFSIHFGISG